MASRVWAIVVLAVVAIAGGAQGASAHEFHTEALPSVVTGQGGNQVIKFQGWQIDCKAVTYAGTMSALEADQVTLHPTFGPCEIAEQLSVSVTSEGCNFVFDSDTIESPHFPGKEVALLKIECEAGKAVTIRTPSCTVEVGGAPNNQAVVGVNYSNGGEGTRDVDLAANLKTIHYTVKGFGCLLIGLKTGTFTDWSITGNATLTAYEDLGGTGEGPFKEGAQVGIWVE